MASKKGRQIQSPWFGPYLIWEVRHNSLKVAVSPSLCGVIEVSTSMIKKWNFLRQDDPGLFDPDLSDIKLDPSSLPTDPNPENELFLGEALEQGFYNVQAILEHKFQPVPVFPPPNVF